MNHIKWVRNESEGWVRDEIITGEQQAQIMCRYDAESGRTVKPILILFSVIGALLISSGIILVFATNWWMMPLPVKLGVAYLPLLLGQAICVYILLKRYGSTAFREGGATFLCVSFFAAVALVGQSFHIATDLREFILLCGVFALPAAYLFRSKTALTIYVASAAIGIQEWLPYWQQALLLAAAALPLIYFEVRASRNKGVLSLLQILLAYLACMVTATIVYEMSSGFDNLLYEAISAGVMLLLLNEAFIKISPVRVAPSAKFLGILCINATIIIAGFNLEGSVDYGISLIAVAVICMGYAGFRWVTAQKLFLQDFFVISGLLLALLAPLSGVVANMLLFIFGVGFIVFGNRLLRMSYMNIGMAYLVLLIGVRFFDSSLSLLIRGIVFILLGIAFLAVNVIITKKWRAA